MDQNHTIALLNVSIKQSSLKILRYLRLFFKRFGVLVWIRLSPQCRITSFKLLLKRITWIATWLKHIFTCYLPIRNRKIFYLATLAFTTLVVFKFLNAWGLNFVHAWDTQNRALGRIWEISNSVHLYYRSYTFSYVPFHFFELPAT